MSGERTAGTKHAHLQVQVGAPSVTVFSNLHTARYEQLRLGQQSPLGRVAAPVQTQMAHLQWSWRHPVLLRPGSWLAAWGFWGW